MSIYQDQAFIQQLSIKLDQFRKKSEGTYNFRCPLCGDSKKNLRKARGYLFRGKKDQFFFKCYNCNESLVFDRFLARVDPTLHSKYLFDRYTDKTDNSLRMTDSAEPEKAAPKSLFNKSKLGSFCTEIKNLPLSHFAYQYLLQRNIPQTVIDSELFYTADFKKMVEEILEETGLGLSKETYSKMIDNDQRIIVPFTNAKGDIVGFQGRSLDPRNKVKYITIKFDPIAPKVYGLNKLDITQDKIYVFEGPFDSMFIPNSIALMDSALYNVVNLLPHIPPEKFVLVFDNEPRNPDIVKAMVEAIKLQLRIVIFSKVVGEEYEKNKDINDLVSKGKIPPAAIHDAIDKHTFKNKTLTDRFSTEMALAVWKKI